MASTNFVDQLTVIEADWLNDIDRLHYDIFNDPADIDAVVDLFRVATTSDKGLMSAADKTLLTSEVLRRDGSVSLTGNLDADSNKIINLPAGSTATDAATIGGAETLSNKTLASPVLDVPTTGGTATAYTVTYGLSAYTSGEVYAANINQANTGNSTINFDSLGAKTIKYYNGHEITANTLQARVHYFYYDGTDMIVIDPAHITVDLSSAASDYTLQPGEAAYVEWSSATSKACRMGLIQGGRYTFSGGTDKTGLTEYMRLHPNNTTYAGAIIESSDFTVVGSSTSGSTVTNSYLDLAGNGDHMPSGDIRVGEHFNAANWQFRSYNGTTEIMVNASAYWAGTTWTTLGTLHFASSCDGSFFVKCEGVVDQ